MVDYISPFKPNPKDEVESYSSRTKPQRPPSNDHFRKSDRERRPTQQKDEEEPLSSVEEREEPRPSLFDLQKSNKKNKSSSNKSTLKDSPELASPRSLAPKEDQGEESNFFDQPEEETEMVSSDEMPESNPEESHADASRPEKMDLLKQQTVSAKGKGSKEEGLFETNRSGQTSKKSKTDKSEASKSEGAEAKGDTSGSIHSSIQSVAFHTETSEANQEAIQPNTIKEIAAEIIDRIQIMRQGNETQTIITLRNPPILDGATITLTASDNAKREFNISFANLSPDAKLLLDRQLKENSLTDKLDQKGIIVHVLTTSTEPENALRPDAGQNFRDRQDQREEKEQQQQRQKQQSFDDSEEE